MILKLIMLNFNSTGLVYTLRGSAQSQGLPCSARFEKSPCLLAHTVSQPEGMVETTSKNIRHDPHADSASSSMKPF